MGVRLAVVLCAGVSKGRAVGLEEVHRLLLREQMRTEQRTLITFSTFPSAHITNSRIRMSTAPKRDPPISPTTILKGKTLTCNTSKLITPFFAIGGTSAYPIAGCPFSIALACSGVVFRSCISNSKSWSSGRVWVCELGEEAGVGTD